MKINYQVTIFIIFIIFFINSCSNIVENKPLNGVFNGSPWSVKTAKATLSLDSVILLDFYDTEIKNLCTDPDAGLIISTTCSMKVGKYEFGVSKPRVAFFKNQVSTLTATEGYLEITSIAPDKKSISGKMVIKLDEQNEVKGIFNATVCEQNQFDNILNQMDDKIDSLENKNK